MNKELRWKQRFQNFKNTYRQLQTASTKEELSELERSGLVQTFEYTFELAWKTLKDFLETEGITVNTPREAIQEAFKGHFIAEGHAWIDALEKRNLLSHCYSEELSLKAESLIKTLYYPFLKTFKEEFEKKE